MMTDFLRWLFPRWLFPSYHKQKRFWDDICAEHNAELFRKVDDDR